MAKLTDTQLVILSAAAGNADGSALPLPKSLKLQGGAATSVLKSLVKKDLLAETPAARDVASWREGEDGRRMTLVVTEAGLKAIGAESDSESGKPTMAPKTRPKRKAAKTKTARRTRTTGRKPTIAGAKRKPSPVAGGRGTKQALLIGLLERKRGATIDEIVAATGWQAHSVRGAISGALKKKLGLTVTSEPVEGRGRVYRIAG